eukprot:Gb_32282 [translate_table: standard]
MNSMTFGRKTKPSIWSGRHCLTTTSRKLLMLLSLHLSPRMKMFNPHGRSKSCFLLIMNSARSSESEGEDLGGFIVDEVDDLESGLDPEGSTRVKDKSAFDTSDLELIKIAWKKLYRPKKGRASRVRRALFRPEEEALNGLQVASPLISNVGSSTTTILRASSYAPCTPEGMSLDCPNQLGKIQIAIVPDVVKIDEPRSDETEGNIGGHWHAKEFGDSMDVVKFDEKVHVVCLVEEVLENSPLVPNANIRSSVNKSSYSKVKTDVHGSVRLMGSDLVVLSDFESKRNEATLRRKRKTLPSSHETFDIQTTQVAEMETQNRMNSTGPYLFVVDAKHEPYACSKLDGDVEGDDLCANKESECVLDMKFRRLQRIRDELHSAEQCKECTCLIEEVQSSLRRACAALEKLNVFRWQSSEDLEELENLGSQNSAKLVKWSQIQKSRASRIQMAPDFANGEKSVVKLAQALSEPTHANNDGEGQEKAQGITQRGKMILWTGYMVHAEGATHWEIQVARLEAHVEQIVDESLEYPEAEVLDKDADPPIVFSLGVGTRNCLSALIRKGENVNAKLKEGLGSSIAHVCAFHGQPDCMHELFLVGGDPNAADDEGVLHRAITKKHTDCAIVILENGGCKSMGILNSNQLTYGTDFFHGVVELHAASVSCMNLKPSNLLLDARGRAVVSDFGLPKILKKH